MVIEMLLIGFFSAWGWIGANYVKDQIWPPEPTPVVIIQEEKKEK